MRRYSAGSMQIFITGASGFIGRALHERYVADGHIVTGCDLAADPGRSGELRGGLVNVSSAV
jgi:nucleoside-diphosphate-sugar epimerase